MRSFYEVFFVDDDDKPGDDSDKILNFNVKERCYLRIYHASCMYTYTDAHDSEYANDDEKIDIYYLCRRVYFIRTSHQEGLVFCFLRQ